MTMSNSLAPSLATADASWRRVETRPAPSGNPMTTPTGMPEPLMRETTVETQQGLTMAQAKR